MIKMYINNLDNFTFAKENIYRVELEVELKFESAIYESKFIFS